jgi:hypothetical protein
MVKITAEFLHTHSRCAALCANATIPGDQLRGILELARSTGVDIPGIVRLRDASAQSEVTVTGRELRMLLKLALKAKQGPTLRAI